MMRTGLMALLLVLAGCGVPQGVDPVSMSRMHGRWNLDSPVFFASGARVLAAVTCKNRHRIVVCDPLRPVRPFFFGRMGRAPGAFLRPNGIASMDLPGKPASALIVVERDNRRLQIVSVGPEGRSLAVLPHPVLKKPYGIAVHVDADKKTFLYVTDALPTVRGERVHRFQLYTPAESIPPRYHLRLDRSFGTAAEGLHIPESVVVDPRYGRIILCDETRGKSRLQVYSLEGRFLFSRGAGRFRLDAEGIAFAPESEGGYLLAADQLPVTMIRLFERESLRYAGSTRLSATSHTDGIAVGQVGGRALLAAVHRDRAVHFYLVRDIVRARRK